MSTQAFGASGVGVTVRLVAGNLPSSVKFDNLLPPMGREVVVKISSAAVRVRNAGPAVAYIELIGRDHPDQLALITVPTGMPLDPGQSIVLATRGVAHLGAVTEIGTATLFATPGEGGI